MADDGTGRSGQGPRDAGELLELVVRESGVPPAQQVAELSETLAMVQTGELAGWLESLMEYLDPEISGELREYHLLALKGTVRAFRDRNLSPFMPQHREIIPDMLRDITQVYTQVRASGADYSREAFGLRAFDYGIHKVYYLDWRLYLSKEMY